MPWGEIGAFALVLAVVFTVGRLWFHLVEALLSGARRLLSRRGKPAAWHPLPKGEAPEKKPESPAGPGLK